jgi:hypothetical protein
MKVLLSSLLLSVSFFAQTTLAQSNSSLPTIAQLVGTWTLISIQDTVDGKAQPSAQFGPHPQGFLMYEPDGHMCATLVNSDRPIWKDPGKPTDAEKIAYYDTLIAYCGTYKLDPEKSVVTHYPTIAWTPAYIGSTQPRPFRLEGDRLIITTKILDPSVEKRVLVWQRAQTGEH